MGGDSPLSERCRKMGLGSDCLCFAVLCVGDCPVERRPLDTGAGAAFWWQIDALPGQTQDDMNDI